MTRPTSTPPPMAIFAMIVGLLLILGAALTTTSAAARWGLLGAAVAYAGLSAYTFRILRTAHRQSEDIEQLEDALSVASAKQASLRNRMVSTFRDPLNVIVALTDRLITDPGIDAPDRTVMLEQIRDSANEVNGTLADLASQPERLAEHPTQAGVVLLDHEARSVIDTAPDGTHYASDLKPARAFADSAKVRQIIRTILHAANAAHCDEVTIKTNERSTWAVITLSAQGDLLPLEGIAALTGHTESGDTDNTTYVALRDAHTMAADMGGTVGYTEALGMSHVIVELQRAPGEGQAQTEAQRMRVPRSTRARADEPSPPTITEMGFTAAVDLRPERPTAAIRFS